MLEAFLVLPTRLGVDMFHGHGEPRRLARPVRAGAFLLRGAGGHGAAGGIAGGDCRARLRGTDTPPARGLMIAQAHGQPSVGLCEMATRSARNQPWTGY